MTAPSIGGGHVPIDPGIGKVWGSNGSGAAAAVAGTLDPLVTALGMVAWTVDPRIANQTGTQANVHAIAVFLPAGTVIKTLAVPMTAAGVAVTHAQLGIYDTNLNLVAQTADSPTSFQGAAGWVALNLTSPYTVPADGLYYLASAYAATTTLPTILNILQNSTIGGAQLPNTAAKYTGIHGPAQGTLPTPLTSVSTFSNVPVIIAY